MVRSLKPSSEAAARCEPPRT